MEKKENADIYIKIFLENILINIDQSIKAQLPQLL